jgi:hypothetical protein
MQRNTVNDIPIIPPAATLDDTIETADLSHPHRDETLPGMNDEQPLSTQDLSGEMGEMIAQADELIAHEPPAPPVVPETPTVEQLESEVLKAAEEKQQEEDTPRQAEAEAQPEPQKTADENPSREMAEAQQAAAGKKARKAQANLDAQRRKARIKRILVTLVTILLTGSLLVGGYLFYTGYYVQMIH